jgi:hypothetical protein
MNTISLIGLILVIGTILVVWLIRLYLQDTSTPDTDEKLYWAVDCTLYNGQLWFDKQFTLVSDRFETDDLRLMAQATVEQYMVAMHYPKGEYTIGYITSLSEDEYCRIRKDLFVTLHGYGYD